MYDTNSAENNLNVLTEQEESLWPSLTRGHESKQPIIELNMEWTVQEKVLTIACVAL